MIASWAEIATVLGLGSTLTDKQRALINLLHPMVEQAIKDEMQMDIEQGTKIEFLPANWRTGERGDLTDGDVEVSSSRVTIGPRGRHTDILQLKHLPVVTTSIEVREDPGAYAGQSSGAFGDSTILTHGTQYYLDLDSSGISRTGRLYRVGAWPSEPRSIKVTYLGGWTRAQLDSGEGLPFKQAVLLTAQKAYTQATQAANGGAVVSESLGHYSRVLDSVTAQLMTGMVIAIPMEAMQLLQKKRNYGRLFG